MSPSPAVAATNTLITVERPSVGMAVWNLHIPGR